MMFSSLIDHRRPHTLLTEDTMGTSTLVYRYEDTGDIVHVPNCWYNQTFVERVEYINNLAVKESDRADTLEKNIDDSKYGRRIADLVARHRARALLCRNEAKRIGAEAKRDYPVAATRLPLKIGPEIED